ncbi:MAG: tetratricopeptide repeat protein [Planctomycetaceae bacterium]|nr:tetratricopeptide repeat protein [Planctomycetaceae bacterium]
MSVNGNNIGDDKELDRAFALFKDGNIRQAGEICRGILEKTPAQIDALQLLGVIYGKEAKYAESAELLEKVIELRPDLPKVYNNLGFALMKLGNLEKAEAAFEKAVSLQTDFKQAYNNLGLVSKKLGNFAQAEIAFDKTLQIDPNYAEVIANLGMTFLAQGKCEQAAEYLRKAIKLMPKFAEFYNNLGTAVMELEQFDEALAAFGKAIEIEPQLAQPHHNRALVMLLLGQFEQGWKEYEWRWMNSGFSTPHRPFMQKRWDGSVEGVGKLLVWGEQGIGDEVQFSSFIPLITAKGINVIVECDKRLVSILQRSLPNVAVFARSDVPAKELDDDSITHQIPVCSLPQVLGWPVNLQPHILPDENLRKQLRDKYKAGKDILLAGISWRSGNSQEGAKRSIDLELWEPIFKIAGVKFVSLQYGQCQKQIQQANQKFGIEIIKDENVNPLTDLEGFCAQTAAMDIVISVDNSTVHFAGVMGTRVWTMLATVPDWRWGLQGETTCWYPSMKLFRQHKRGDWRPVIAKVATELKNKNQK